MWDPKAYVHKRKRKYMAQVLEVFERTIEPLLPESDQNRKKIEDFKALTRMRLNALAVDACDVMDGEVEINGAGQDVRDKLHHGGRP